MVADKLKSISDIHGWQFSEGDAYQQNLADNPDESDLMFIDKTKYLMLYDYNESTTENDFGALLYTNFDCMLFFSVRSGFSEPGGYNRTQKYINKVRADFNKIKEHFKICSDWELEVKSISNKLNQLDTNMDGIMVSCIIKYNHNYDSLV